MFDFSRIHELEHRLAAQRERVHIPGPVPEPSQYPGRPQVRPVAELVIPDGWMGLLFQDGRLQLRLPAGPQHFSAAGLCEVRLMPADTVDEGQPASGRTLWFADGRLLCTERRWAKDELPAASGTPHRTAPLGRRSRLEEDPDVSFSFV